MYVCAGAGAGGRARGGGGGATIGDKNVNYAHNSGELDKYTNTFKDEKSTKDEDHEQHAPTQDYTAHRNNICICPSQLYLVQHLLQKTFSKTPEKRVPALVKQFRTVCMHMLIQ